MKPNTFLIWTALLSVALTVPLHAQLPNAWQIDDHATNAALSYSTTIPVSDQEAATNLNGGWSYTVHARFVTDHDAGNQAMVMIYGDGVTRWEILWSLTGGELQSTLYDAGGTTNVSSGGMGTNFYHTHQIVYDPTNQTASYLVDGQVLVTNWTGSPAAWTAGRVFWGSVSAGGVGVMNFNSINFAVTNQVVASYDAGTENNPTTAPDPAASGWVMSPSVPATNTAAGPVNADPIVILPNAWQITDNSSAGSSSPHYTRILSAGLQVAATNGGFRFAVNSRLISSPTTPSMIMLYGLGTKRFLVQFDLNAQADLTAALEGGGTYILTTNGTGTNLYHTHEIIYNPTAGKASYAFDGQVKTTNWTVSPTAFAAGTIYWGSGSSAGQGTMNFHSVSFEVTNNGVASYDAGAGGIPANAPDPETQGWTYVLTGAGAVTNVSPDFVPVPAVPVATTLAATVVEAHQATLSGSVDQGNLAATVWFEWGTTTNYGSATPSRQLLSETNQFNLSELVGGLNIGTGYHFRCVASNLQGIAYGADAMFTTPVESVVTTLADSGAGSLRQRLAAAQPGETISFATNGTITLTSGEFSISNSLTISGPGKTNLLINGNGADRVFAIEGGVNAVMSGLTITNGSSANGGGIYNNGTLSLSNLVITGSTASSDGGAIINYGPMTLSDCMLAGNTANSGGAIATYYSDSLTLSNCTLTGNSALSGNGGGINIYDATVTVLGSTLADNSASNVGGGINNAIGDLTLINAVLTGNSATNSGGGIYNTGSLGIHGSLFSGNSCLGDGGGIYNQTVMVSLDDTTLSNNTAASGGGIANYYSGMLTLSNCTFSGNTALSVNGGGINIYHAEANLIHCTLAGNSANNVGGAINNDGGALALTESALSNNTAVLGGGIAIVNYDPSELTLSQVVFANNTAWVDGGALNTGGATVNIQQCLFTGNHTMSYNGGAIHGGGNLWVVDTTFDSNQAQLRGGAIHHDFGTLTIINSTIAGNSANDHGGGVAVEHAALNLTNVTITVNTANADGELFGQLAGGIHNDNGIVQVQNSIIAGNAASNTLSVDVYGPFLSGGFNLVGVTNSSSGWIGGDITNGSPHLAPLGDYGGPTQTMPPLPGSPAIDAGNDAAASGFAFDQRGPGYPRVSGDHVDIGAVEVQLITGSTPVEITDLTSLGNGTFQFSFTNDLGASFRVLATTNITLPLTNWTFIGFATEVPPGSGQFQFTDLDATNFTERYYGVKSP